MYLIGSDTLERVAKGLTAGANPTQKRIGKGLCPEQAILPSTNYGSGRTITKCCIFARRRSGVDRFFVGRSSDE